MEEAKEEVEKKVSRLLNFIQNKNKIPKGTKKELLLIVNDLHDKTRKVGTQVSDQDKLVKQQEDMIHRLSMEINDQKKLLKEQKDAIDKFNEDQKIMKRWSFGTKLIDTNLVERKMEELAEDFRMKMEDHIRILNRRINVAEHIQMESRNMYNKTRDINTQTQEKRGDATVFKKMEEMVEKGFAGPEKAIKKLEEGGELVSRVSGLTKEIDSTRKWVKEKKSKTKDEVETLEAKLECKEAQECLVKEKLSKLEAKLTEEGTEKLSLEKAKRRIKKLEIDVKEKEFELLNLKEGKREAIRQLCVLADYNRCRYDELKTSIYKVALRA